MSTLEEQKQILLTIRISHSLLMEELTKKFPDISLDDLIYYLLVDTIYNTYLLPNGEETFQKAQKEIERLLKKPEKK